VYLDAFDRRFPGCGPLFMRGYARFSRHRPWRAWTAFGPLGGGRRFFESGEVRLAILSLLEDGPKHGYELIKQLEIRSGGLYRASAGTVYPTLQLLEDEGLVVSETEGGKRVYRLTEEGRRELEREAEAVSDIWGRAESWEEWSHWIGPDAVVLVRPVAAVVKSAFRALRAAGDSSERQAKLRGVLDRARAELDAIGKSSPPRS
jgi:DNA-binding PadR family transcriptional regulator